MRHQTVVAPVGARHDDGHHLALELREPRRRQHQLIVHRDEVAQLLRAQAIGAQHIRHNAELFGAQREEFPQILIERLRIGDRKRRDVVRLWHV
jgi:hypothetical protein